MYRYRPFGTFRLDCKVIKDMREKARKIYKNKVWSYDTKEKKIKKLILTLFENN